MLVNNAGVACLAPFLQITKDQFDLTFDVNVRGIFNVSQVVAGDMINRKSKGNIVNLSSQASQAALRDHSAYCASKGAVDMLTRFFSLLRFHFFFQARILSQNDWSLIYYYFFNLFTLLWSHHECSTGEEYTYPRACHCYFFRSLALELGPHNIRVNSVNPTVVLTEMGKLGWSDSAKAQTMLDKIPLGRFAGKMLSLALV